MFRGGSVLGNIHLTCWSCWTNTREEVKGRSCLVLRGSGYDRLRGRCVCELAMLKVAAEATTRCWMRFYGAHTWICWRCRMIDDDT